MRTAADILAEHGLSIRSDAHGRYYTTCPQCSAKRTKAHQANKVLGVTIDGNGVQWGCNHCGWTGGAYYNGKANGHDHSGIIATYDYVDENGELLFQVCRRADKSFPQRRPDGKGGWIWGTKDVRKVLYRLPELVEAIASGHPILIHEGEKDANAAWRIGLPATCNPGGASEPGKKTKWRKEYSETLRDADIIILPDNDDAGRAHADEIARMSTGIAKRVRVLDLAAHWPEVAAKKGGDLSDGIAAGRTREEIDQLIDATPDYVADEAPIVPEQHQQANLWPWQFYGRHEIAVVRPYLVSKLLPETGVGLISGQWGTFKTFAAIDLAAAVITGTPFAGFEVARQGAVLFVAMEGEGEVDPRMRAALSHRGYTKELAPFAWINTCPRLLDDDAGGRLSRTW